ncbi:MAG: hypothetical protein OJF59_000802 [Cytophagales bacterium]|jgi:hypothetical protein|nr:hypothetical protein [Bacteroidota bacterium]MBS1979793.1 hypothetical protein [Bacteroidota bacterium]WHZ07049.1 MAG: hypothetical protein OJF59_000802 [Cytophagales bacterium]
METTKPGNPEKIAQDKAYPEKDAVKKARITAVVFGMITSVALICLVYAYVQKGVADERLKRANELETKLQQCEQEAMRQQKIAEYNANEAKRQQKLADDQVRNGKKYLKK